MSISGNSILNYNTMPYGNYGGGQTMFAQNVYISDRDVQRIQHAFTELKNVLVMVGVMPQDGTDEAKTKASYDEGYKQGYEDGSEDCS